MVIRLSPREGDIVELENGNYAVVLKVKGVLLVCNNNEEFYVSERKVKVLSSAEIKKVFIEKIINQR